MDVSAYRKTYFALVRSAGLDEDTRHAFNRAQTGKESTGEFTVSDWRIVVAELQRLNGQDVRPGQPHIRGQRGGTPGGMITPAQLEALTTLAGRIAWRVGAEAFVRGRLLSPMRRQGWSGRWEDLFRGEAAGVIAALRRMGERPGTDAGVRQ